jgi:hypothetical protein
MKQMKMESRSGSLLFQSQQLVMENRKGLLDHRFNDRAALGKKFHCISTLKTSGCPSGRFDTIYTGSISNPQFRDIYAPLDEFVMNGGVKLRL